MTKFNLQKFNVSPPAEETIISQLFQPLISYLKESNHIQLG